MYGMTPSHQPPQLRILAELFYTYVWDDSPTPPTYSSESRGSYAVDMYGMTPQPQLRIMGELLCTYME